MGGGKFGQGHDHRGGAANATINEALKPFYSFFAASLAALRRSSLYGAVSRKEKRPFSISNSLQPVSGSTPVSLQTAGCLRLYAVSLFLRCWMAAMHRRQLRRLWRYCYAHLQHRCCYTGRKCLDCRCISVICLAILKTEYDDEPLSAAQRFFFFR